MIIGPRRDQDSPTLPQKNGAWHIEVESSSTKLLDCRQAALQ